MITGSAGLALPLPNAPVFQGMALRMQAVVFDQSLPPSGIGASNALTVILGH